MRGFFSFALSVERRPCSNAVNVLLRYLRRSHEPPARSGVSRVRRVPIVLRRASRHVRRVRATPRPADGGRFRRPFVRASRAEVIAGLAASMSAARVAATAAMKRQQRGNESDPVQRYPLNSIRRERATCCTDSTANARIL